MKLNSFLTSYAIRIHYSTFICTSNNRLPEKNVPSKNYFLKTENKTDEEFS